MLQRKEVKETKLNRGTYNGAGGLHFLVFLDLRCLIADGGGVLLEGLWDLWDLDLEAEQLSSCWRLVSDGSRWQTSLGSNPSSAMRAMASDEGAGTGDGVVAEGTYDSQAWARMAAAVGR